MINNKQVYTILFAGIVIVLFISTVFVFNNKPRPAAEPPLEKVSLGLSWIHQAQFAGEYFADQQGLYRTAGLDVTLIPAAIHSDPLDDLLQGKRDFVISQPDSLIRARLAGKKIKAIATTYRIHPMVLSSLAEKGIRKPEDLQGKTIGVAYSEGLILKSLLAKQGIDLSTVNIVKRNYDFADLQSGKLDVQAAWIINEVQKAQRAGLQLTNILPSDYDVVFYADLIVTTEHTIEERPDLVRRFLQATLQGWAKVFTDVDGNAKLTLHYNPELDIQHERDVLHTSLPLIHTGEHRIGWMTREAWQIMYQLIAGPLDSTAPTIVEELYTLQFLEQ